MLRKIVALLLAVISILSVFTSCTSHEHSFDEETIIEAATCQKAGKKIVKCACGETKTQVVPKAHVWSDSECGEKQTCEICGLVQTNKNIHSLDYATKTCKNCGREAIRIDIPEEKTEVEIRTANGKVISVLLVEAEIESVTTTAVVIKWRAEKISNGDSADDKLTETIVKYQLSEIVKLEDEDKSHEHTIVDGVCTECGSPEYVYYAVKSGASDANAETELGDKVRNITFTLNGLDLWGNYILEFADFNY